jgi:hypothetical protein
MHANIEDKLMARLTEIHCQHTALDFPLFLNAMWSIYVAVGWCVIDEATVSSSPAPNSVPSE